MKMNAITPQNNPLRQMATRQAAPQQDKLITAIRGENMQAMIAAALPEKDRAAFVSEIITAIKATPKLQQCDLESVLAAGLRGRSQHLRLGFHYYIIPYGRLANFQMGYKGLLNLAITSNFYETITVHAIYANEEISIDPVTGAFVMQSGIRVTDDEEEREPIGYSCGFLLKNGFKYSDFMTVKQILKHADKHSSAFSLEKYKKLKEGQLSADEAKSLASGSPWYDIEGDGFDRMCRKTVILRVLNSGFAPITNAMSEAMAIPDEGVIMGASMGVGDSASDPLIIDGTAKEKSADPLKIENAPDAREAAQTVEKSLGKEIPAETAKRAQNAQNTPKTATQKELKQETAPKTAQASLFEA